MKKIVLILFIIANILIFSNSYKTYTVGLNNRLSEIQPAYKVEKIIYSDFFEPEDLFVHNNKFYIADTSNSRIVVKSDDEEYYIGEFELMFPKGVYYKDGKIFVVDDGVGSIFIYDENGVMLKTIGKPNTPLFGKRNVFVPKKVAVDNRGNIYVVSEGSTEGVLVFNKDGEFINYFGVNNPDVSLKMILQRIFLKAKLLKIKPPSPTNLTIDNKGLLYTVTTGLKNEAIKKFNVAGVNILKNIIASDKLIDIHVDNEGYIYTLSSDGHIYICNSLGDLLFIFGNSDYIEERKGLLNTPIAISVDDNKNIYVLDKEKNYIIKYVPTPFALKVFEGDKYYENGLYIEGKEIWEEIRRMNSFFILSYKALAKAYFKEKNYSKALEYFKIARLKKEYSEAFWQIRNELLQKNLDKIIIVILIIHLLNKYLFSKIKKFEIKNKFPDIFFMINIFKNPFDAYYEIKRNNRVSIYSATILYIWYLIINFMDVLFKGFIFTNTYKINAIEIVYKTFLPLILFIVANYLVSEINDGEGRLKDIYIGLIYALSPKLLFEPILILSTNILTYNEYFFYSFPAFILNMWSIILIVIMVKEIHNYELNEAMKNIFLTLFTIFVILLSSFIIFVLSTQEIDFIYTLIMEMIPRV